MPYLQSSTEWLEQSSLLLKARPSTVSLMRKPLPQHLTRQTRVTSKYTVLKPNARKIKKQQKYLEKKAARPANSSRTSSPPPTAQNPDELKATFTLKTYDPESGTCLQYETNKAAEVGRLIGNLGRLGRHMAALPEVSEDPSAPADGAGISTPKAEEDIKMGGVPAEPKASAPSGASGSGGKKKKKGKK